MKNDSKEFQEYATKHKGISSLNLHHFNAHAMNNMMKPMNMTPYIMEERQLNVAQIDVFSRLMCDRIIWMLGEVEEVGSAIIQAQLMYLKSVDGKKAISIHIDSPGGDIVSGFKILDIMEYIECDIHTINTGMAASMASIILAAGKKGKRSSLKHSRTMLHQSSGGAVGNIQDARIMMEEWEKYNRDLFELLGKYCGKSDKKVMEDASRDKWMSAQEAKDYGIIDSFIGEKIKK